MSKVLGFVVFWRGLPLKSNVQYSSKNCIPLNNEWTIHTVCRNLANFTVLFTELSTSRSVGLRICPNHCSMRVTRLPWQHWNGHHNRVTSTAPFLCVLPQTQQQGRPQGLAGTPLTSYLPSPSIACTVQVIHLALLLQPVRDEVCHADCQVITATDR